MVFGSIVAFNSYMYLLKNVRPAAATSYAYVNPAVAVLLGDCCSSARPSAWRKRWRCGDHQRGRADWPAPVASGASAASRGADNPANRKPYERVNCAPLYIRLQTLLQIRAEFSYGTPMTFASLGLIEPLLRSLETLGYQTPTPVQAQAIPAVLAGRDLMAAAQTGTGKTAGFALPLLQMLTMEGPKVAANSARALVLVPTRELAEQVHEVCAPVRRKPAAAHLRGVRRRQHQPANDEAARRRRRAGRHAWSPDRPVPPERAETHQLQTLMLDEADRMLDLGFSEELANIYPCCRKSARPCCSPRPSPMTIRLLAGQMLNNPLTIEVSPRNVAATPSSSGS